MDREGILSELRAERDRINNAIAAIQSLDGAGRAQTRPAGARPKRSRRRMSAEARKRLSDLLKKRWAQGKMGKSKRKAA